MSHFEPIIQTNPNPPSNLNQEQLESKKSKANLHGVWTIFSKLWHQLGAALFLSVIILSVLFIISPEQAKQSIIFMAGALWRIFPFIVLSVTIAAALKASGADQTVAKTFEGNPGKAIILASIFGALSPFCSCGVIPIVVGLLVAGVPIAPVLAFCIASPIMDPEMFILTSAGLGFEFTIFKTVSAVMMGLMTGYITLLLTKTGALNNALKAVAKPSCTTTKCSNKPTKTKTDWKFWGRPDQRLVFWREAGHTAWFLIRWLSFAFLLESLMVTYLPGQTVAAWLGEGNPLAIPLAVILGVPAYLNGYAAIPLVRGLIDLGMSPATGLAFMLAGSVTSIPAAIAVWTIAKPHLFALYLVMATLGAFTMGLLYAAFIALST